MTARLWRIFLSLGLVKLCIAGLIRQAPLEKRLCEADFVFKFKVTSNVKKYCWGTPLFNSRTKVPTTRPNLVPSPSTLPATSRVSTAPTLPRSSSASIGNGTPSTNNPSFTLQTTAHPTNQSGPSSSTSQLSQEISTRNAVVRKGTSSGRVDLHVPEKNQSGPEEAIAHRVRRSARWRRSFCFHVISFQDIRIIKKHVYKGLDGIKKMSGVKDTVGKHYYESRVKRDLNFSRKLNLNEEYLFVGKRIPKGKLEDHIFTANRGTVESWTEAKNRLTKFNFDTKCKSS